MNPKEKAKELFDKYLKGKDENGWSLCEFNSCAKQSALIAVNEMIRICYDHHMASYYGEVRQEIEKL